MLYELLVLITTITFILLVGVVFIISIEVNYLFRDYVMADASPTPTPADSGMGAPYATSTAPVIQKPNMPYFPQAKPRITAAPDYRPYLNTHEIGIDRQLAKASYARMLADMYSEEMWTRAHTDHISNPSPVPYMTFSEFKSTLNPHFHDLNTEIFKHAAMIHVWILREEGGPNSTEVAKHLRYLAYITRYFPNAGALLDDISEGSSTEMECAEGCECDDCQRHRLENPFTPRANEVTPTPLPSPATKTD
jgi:hypothetical protein